MRWSIIRLIWLRELRDQLRDRRTLFMIAGLPVLLYPIAGLGMIQLAITHAAQSSIVGVVGERNLPQPSLRCVAQSPLSAMAWFRFMPAVPGCPLAGISAAAGAVALVQARQVDPQQDFP